MKHARTFLFVIVFAALAACAPQVTPPPAQELVYAAPAGQVFPAVIRAISTSPALEGSNGWIITQSDRAGGFVAAQTTLSRFVYGSGMVPYNKSVSVVISPNSPQETAVVIQLTCGAGSLASRVRSSLEKAFGAPVGGTLTPN